MKSLLFLLAAGLLVTGIAWPVAAATGQTLSDLMSAVREAPDPETRTTRFYDLARAIDRGTVSPDENTAEAFVLFLVEIILDPESRSESIRAGDLLQKYALPVAADPLVKYLAEQPEDSILTRAMALKVLVRLGDQRCLPYLLADLDSYQPATVQKSIALLTMLGDERAIPSLQGLLTDPARGTPEAAAAAIRRIRLKAEHDIFCPFDLPEDVLAVLAEQGFVVLPLPKNEIFEWYSKEYPFVTTDFVYHTWMILVRAACRDLESVWLRQAVGGLCSRLASDCQGNTAAFCAVPAVLCGAATLPELGLDRAARELAAAELERIARTEGIVFSPMLGVDVDYNEFRPQGRFSAEDGGYFQAMTWLGKATFRAEDPELTRQALELVRALFSSTEAVAAWSDLESVLAVLGGPRDDPGPADYLHLAERIAGREGPLAVTAVLEAPDLLDRFHNEAGRLPPPRINTATDPDRSRARGMRFLGQRYSPDAHIFQLLLEHGTWPPSGLDVLAGVLGSQRAAHHLDREFPHPADMPPDFGPSLMAGFFDCFGPVLAEDQDLPAPFSGAAWQDKCLNSALAAWAETRHATAPYVKCAHIFLGFEMMIERPQGFVEPYPEFFLHLADRADALHDLLSGMDFYAAVEGSDLDRDRLPRFSAVVRRLAVLAGKCREGALQSPGDAAFLQVAADKLRRISFNESSLPVAEESMARITTVATEYLSGQILAAGTGRAQPIFVAVPAGTGRVVCRGGVYSYYEFVRPLSRPPSDASWQEVTTNLDNFCGRPWLEQEADLVFRRRLSREDLRRLAKIVSESNFSDVWRDKPWAFEFRDHRQTAPWITALTSSEDVDLLLELAESQEVTPGVRLLAVKELARHRQVPAAERFFRSQAQRIIEANRPRNGRYRPEDLALLYFAAGVLAGTGDRADRELLEEMDLLVSQANAEGFQGRPAVALQKFYAWFLGRR